MRETRKYTEEEKKNILEGFEKADDRHRFAKGVNVPFGLIYKWRRQQRDVAAKPVSAEVVPLSFNVIQVEEAKQLTSNNRFGRFAEFKSRLIDGISGLRKKQALAISVPAEEKEAKSLFAAGASAIKKSGLPFVVRYSRTKNLLIVMRRA